MMLKKFFNSLLALVILFTTAGGKSSSTIGRVDAWPDFQNHNLDVMVQNNETAGLGFQVVLSGGWPRLKKVPGKTILRTGEQETIENTLFNFGTISSGTQTPTGYSIFEKDWSHIGVSFTQNFKMYISRLTPAIVVESSETSITLFGGGAPIPAYFGISTGVYPRAQLANLPVNNLNQSWLIAWYGSGAGFEGSNFPWHVEREFPLPVYRVDCPILILFQNNPSGLSASSNGITANFPTSVGRIALLPLYGDKHPLATDLSTWTNGIPPSVKSQADWWANKHSQVPIKANDTYTYNSLNDTSTITTQIDFLSIRSGNSLFAPIPPMVSLAIDTGFPMQISGTLYSTTVITDIGVYRGIEGVSQYSYTISGLNQYVMNPVRVTDYPSALEWVKQELIIEVDKIIAAGHLAPWYPATNSFNLYLSNKGIMTWSNPGQILSILGNSLPFLSTSKQTELINYLKNERSNYPPESMVFLAADVGARRERWRIDSEEINRVISIQNDCMNSFNFYKKNNLIPEENLYYLSDFSQYTDPTPLKNNWNNLRSILYPYFYRQDWATLGWYRWQKITGSAQSCYTSDRLGQYNGFGGVIDANHHFTALIGAIRLAILASDSNGEVYLRAQLGRAAILRYALDQYSSYLYKNGLEIYPTDPGWLSKYGSIMYLRYGPSDTDSFISKANLIAGKPDWMVRYLEGSWAGHLFTYNWTSPSMDSRSVVRLDQFGVHFDDLIHPFYGKGFVPYRGMSQELAIFLGDFSQTRSWAAMYVARVAENTPDWFHALGRQSIGQENNYHAPEDALQLFLARAWILKEVNFSLASYLDVPWMERGDLFYIQKMVAILSAGTLPPKAFLPVILKMSY